MMSFVGSGTTGTEAAQKFLESLQNDFRNLSAETKKKNPQIKEVRMMCSIKINNEYEMLISANVIMFVLYHVNFCSNISLRLQ